MRTCFVTAVPPSKWGLNEYGCRITRELQDPPLIFAILTPRPGFFAADDRGTQWM